MVLGRGGHLPALSVEGLLGVEAGHTGPSEDEDGCPVRGSLCASTLNCACPLTESPVP